MIETRQIDSVSTEEEKLVSTKELAEMLGVDEKTIQRTVTSLDIDVERVGSSHKMMFNEQQATLIKIELQNHSKLARNGFNTVSISNDLEMMLMQQKLSEYQNMRIQQLTRELNNANTQLLELAPKAEFYDAVTGSKDCIEMKEVAKILNIKDMGRNKLFEILRNKKILDRNNQPYQKYVDAGLFRIVESKYCVNGDVRINLKTVVFQKGIDFIKKILFEEVGTKKMSVDCHKYVYKVEGR